MPRLVLGSRNKKKLGELVDLLDITKNQAAAQMPEFGLVVEPPTVGAEINLFCPGKFGRNSSNKSGFGGMTMDNIIFTFFNDKKQFFQGASII